MHDEFLYLKTWDVTFKIYFLPEGVEHEAKEVDRAI
jgi:hypothetical protein